MSVMASQITGVSIVCSTVCSGSDQRKHQSSVSLAFVRGIHRSSVYSTQNGPETRKMFPFDDAIITLKREPCAYSWWRHQMETLSALLAICAGIHRPPVNSPHKGQWRGALMFSLICVWINGWVNNREAGDLRRYRAHYDVTVMFPEIWYATLNNIYVRIIYIPFLQNKK